MSNSPGSERTACQDGMVAKARNHARVASALPHSEGIADKPPCGEVAMCRRVGRMGPVKRGRTGTAEPGPERGPLKTIRDMIVDEMRTAVRRRDIAGARN